MKHLLTIILLLACLGVNGQDWDGFYRAKLIGICLKIDAAQAEIDSFNIITIDMILDYAEECYNDSVKVYGFTTKYNRDLFYEGSHPINSLWIKQYQPKDTFLFKPSYREPTFSGFIEWIEKKHKVK